MADIHPGLAKLFGAVWDAFIEGYTIDGADLEPMLEATGLVEWRNATQEDVDTSGLEIEVGDPLLFLTEEGKAVIKAGKGKP